MAFDYNTLSRLSGISSDDIYSVLRNKQAHYKQIYIKKRNGEKRRLDSPSDVLARLQRVVVKAVFLRYKTSKNTAAYEKGCSPVKTARRHTAAKTLISTDIKSFFASVDFYSVRKLLQKKFKSDEIGVIWDVISLGGGLPIGAPSSPAVSNRIMLELDKKIARAAKGCIYTRYADDISISSKKLDPVRASEILDNVQNILFEGGFKLNEQKTRIKDKTKSQRVLGLIVNEGKTSIGLKKRKKLKKDVYNFLVHKKGSKKRIKGRISYYKYAEPDFIKKVEAKYRPLGYYRHFG